MVLLERDNILVYLDPHMKKRDKERNNMSNKNGFVIPSFCHKHTILLKRKIFLYNKSEYLLLFLFTKNLLLFLLILIIFYFYIYYLTFLSRVLFPHLLSNSLFLFLFSFISISFSSYSFHTSAAQNILSNSNH